MSDMLWQEYMIMIPIWIAFQGAVNKTFPSNDFMLRNMHVEHGELLPYWGVLAGIWWPVTLAYLLFLLLLLPIKGVQAGISAHKRRIEEKNRFKIVPVLKYPGGA